MSQRRSGGTEEDSIQRLVALREQDAHLARIVRAVLESELQVGQHGQPATGDWSGLDGSIALIPWPALSQGSITLRLIQPDSAITIAD